MHNIGENRIRATPPFNINQNVDPVHNNSSPRKNPSKSFLCELHSYSIYYNDSQNNISFINASIIVGHFFYYDNLTVYFI